MAVRHPFLNRFWRFVRENRLVEPGQKIVVAVSGGVDSVVLLHCLRNFAAKNRNELVVAHFHHGLRGAEADADEAFVRGLAEAAGLPFFSERGDVAAYAREKGLSTEEAGRELRYAFLERVRRETGADLIATGHHASDQAETVLYRLARGAGWRGLAGIPLRRGPIVRPLLFAYREDIEAFAAEAGLSYRLDRSNYELDFRRNVIRREVLPLLRERVNAGVDSHLVAAAAFFREGDAFLRAEAEKAFRDCVTQIKSRKIILEIDSFCRYFKIIQKYVLLHAAELLGIPPDNLTARKLNLAAELIAQRRAGKRILLGGPWLLEIGQAEIRLHQREKVSPAAAVSFRIGEPVSVEELGLTFLARRIPCKEVRFTADPLTEFVDADRLSSDRFLLRPVQPGERFVPLGTAGTKKISDFFIDAKIPRAERQNALVLEQEGKIVWLVGYRLDDRFKVNKTSKNCVQLTVRYD